MDIYIFSNIAFMFTVFLVGLIVVLVIFKFVLNLMREHPQPVWPQLVAGFKRVGAFTAATAGILFVATVFIVLAALR